MNNEENYRQQGVSLTSIIETCLESWKKNSSFISIDEEAFEDFASYLENSILDYYVSNAEILIQELRSTNVRHEIEDMFVRSFQKDGSL